MAHEIELVESEKGEFIDRIKPLKELAAIP